MKTLKHIREEYNANFLPQIVPESIMLESKTYTSSASVPSPSKMPAMLLFRRVSYKMFPGRNYVALYYSKMLDKYLSIPFGPEGNLNLSESTVYDTLEELELAEGAKWEALKGGIKGAAHGAVKGLFKGNAVAAEPGMAVGAVVGGVHGAYKGAKNAYKKAKDKEVNEDWQSVNRKDKTDGLSQAAVNAYRRENPGSKLQTAVTEKNPKGKRAARRKSFCSRMGGMKKRLTSAKTARDPDSRINKALRRWNCEESFRQKLSEIREERQVNEFAVPLIQGVGRLALGTAAGEALVAGAKQAIKKAPQIASRFMSKFKSKQKGTPRDASSMAKSGKKSSGSGAGTAAAGAAGSVAGDAAYDAIKSSIGLSKSAEEPSKQITLNKPNVAPKSSWAQRATSDPIYKAKMKSQSLAPMKENKISDLRNMINEGIDTKNLFINGRTITLNSSMAKRIVEVYDSVNVKNKKIVENMLNDDLESFKKLLNFSIKA